MGNWIPCIVSDDCWGGEFYREFGLPYSSPFIGLYVEPSSYINAILNTESLMNEPLEFENSSKPFPVGRVGEIVLNFMHYSDSESAASVWQRRCKRFQLEKSYYKVDFSPRSPFGSPGYSDEDIERWNSLASPRHLALVNTSNMLDKVKNSYYVSGWQTDAAKTYHTFREEWSILAWLRSSK